MNNSTRYHYRDKREVSRLSLFVWLPIRGFTNKARMDDYSSAYSGGCPYDNEHAQDTDECYGQ